MAEQLMLKRTMRSSDASAARRRNLRKSTLEVLCSSGAAQAPLLPMIHAPAIQSATCSSPALPGAALSSKDLVLSLRRHSHRPLLHGVMPELASLDLAIAQLAPPTSPAGNCAPQTWSAKCWTRHSRPHIHHQNCSETMPYQVQHPSLTVATCRTHDGRAKQSAHRAHVQLPAGELLETHLPDYPRNSEDYA